MAVYQYTAKDETGNKFSGRHEGVESVATLREELDKMGYVLVKAHRAKTQKTKRRKIKRRDIVAFTYKFAGMYSAGLPILRCLETLEEQAENRALKDMLADIRQGVEGGSSLKGAFEKYRHIFSDFFLGMVEAGESGGRLATTLEMSAVYLDKQAELKRKVKSAFVYPVVVSVVCLVVIAGLLAFVIPIFSKLYNRLHVSLPGPTKFLVDLSALFRDWWWAILIVGVVAAIMLRRLLRSPHIKAKWDDFKLNMPLFATLNRMIVISHFTRTFAMLTSVGVSLIEALDVAGVVASNHRVTQVVGELKESVRAGHPIGMSFKNYDIFPAVITQLAVSGEEAGMLPDMLNKGADFLDKDIERTVNGLLIKLEPALTVIMGTIVGFILMGAYLPMFDYMQHLE
jgi:type IV pilus assembly protein PilC